MSDGRPSGRPPFVALNGLRGNYFIVLPHISFLRIYIFIFIQTMQRYIFEIFVRECIQTVCLQIVDRIFGINCNAES